MQALRLAKPAWLAGVLVALPLPAGVHTVEFPLLEAGRATRPFGAPANAPPPHVSTGSG